MRGTAYETFSRAKSNIAYSLCVGFTLLILTVLGLVIGYLVYLGASALSWEFFTEIPSGNPEHPGGMKNALVGTAILVGFASILGVPIGMLTGIFLSEYDTKSRIATPVRFVCDVLAGVPSIVVGILGYELLVVPLGGFNGWAGSLALAFIMIPIIARTTEEMLRLVPNSYREASLAMGATKGKTIFSVVVPAALGSTITGVMLAVARVAGETAPLLFTALGSRYLTLDPSQPFPSLTVQIFSYASGPYEKQRNQAWAGILVLISLIFVLNLAVRLVSRKMQTKNE